jgi:hypothetical protein
MGTFQDPTHPTGVSVTEGAHEAEAQTARERKEDAVLALRMDTKEDTMAALRLGGYDWDEIARILGYPSPRHAVVAYEKALQRNLSADEASTAKMRDLAGRRLERLMRAVWTKAIDPTHPEQLQANDRAAARIAEYARLYGLNAPTEMVVHSPSQEELHSFVAKVVAGANAGLDEDNIFDGEFEEVEDEPKEIGA